MKAIEHLHKVTFSKEQMSKLSKDQQGVLAVLSFAVTEANTLQRIYIHSEHQNTGQDDIDILVATQRFVLLRTWSAALFEFIEFVKSLSKKNGTNCSQLIEWQSNCLSLGKDVVKGEGYTLARNLRHEAANHYNFGAAKKNLDYLSPSANLNMYMHALNGNSYFPMGEEVMFIGRINRTGEGPESIQGDTSKIDNWMAWNIKASKWLNDCNFEFYSLFIRSLKLRAVKRCYWIPPELVSSEESQNVPLFIRSS